MSRDTVTSVTSAAAAPQVRFRLLAEIAVTSSTLYCATGDKFIYSGSNTYSPVGPLGGISPIKESADGQPRGCTLWLRAVSSVDLREPLSEAIFNKSVRLYRAFLSDSYTVVGTPQLGFSGFINKCELKLGDPEKGNYFEIEIESRLKREARSNRFNQETLWQTYSGDTFYVHVTKIPNYRSDWGQLATPAINHGNVNGQGNYDYSWGYI